jgi:hypothetical protein
MPQGNIMAEKVRALNKFAEDSLYIADLMDKI